MLTKIIKKLKDMFKLRKRFKIGQQIYVVQNVLFVKRGIIKEVNKDNILVEVKQGNGSYEEWFTIDYCFTEKNYYKYQKDREREFKKIEKRNRKNREKMNKIIDKFNPQKPLLKRLQEVEYENTFRIHK